MKTPNEIEDRATADDQAWFDAHPTEVVRLRPSVPGEFRSDVADFYGQRRVIAPANWSDDNPVFLPNVAVVDVCRALRDFRYRGEYGPGGRIRFPACHYAPRREETVKALALEATAELWEELRDGFGS